MTNPEDLNNNWQAEDYQTISPQMQDDILEHTIDVQKKTWIEKQKESLNLLTNKLKNLFKKQQDSNENYLKIKEETKLSFWVYFFISKNSLISVLEQLSILLSSGIRLLDALIIIKQQEESQIIKKFLNVIITDVKNGSLFSHSLEKHQKVVPAKWVKLIYAGEKSGEIEKILKDLTQDEIEQQELNSALKGAMAYPVFVIFLTIGLVIYMLVAVVPEISEIYAKMHQKLPAATLMVISLSESIQENYVSFFIVLFSLIIIIKISAHFSLYITYILDWIKLRIPVFGELKKKQNIAVFSGNLSLLLQSGILVVPALNIVQSLLPSPLYRQEISRIIEGVEKGNNISQEMGLIDLEKEEFVKNFYFPLNVSQMVHIGEQTGNLSFLLEKLKINYAKQIRLTIKTFSSLLEPIMIILVGLLVGGILLAVILPFFSMKV